MMETGRIEEQSCQFKVFTTGDLKAEFSPWFVGDRGQQSYIKLKRNDEIAYLYSGMGAVLHAEVQKALMRLVNEGWLTQGELHVSFEGSPDPDVDMFMERDNIALEIGAALLPLVDPYEGAPLLARLNMLREEIAQEIGCLVPSIRVKDNMRIQPNQYFIRLRETIAASWELFLNRYLAIGTLEQLGELKGWSTMEPAYRMNAKWIEVGEKDQAEKTGCMVQGGLNVLLTHLKETIKANAGRVLGLQETCQLLQRLGGSHPVVVEEFLADLKSLRTVRKILQNLLAENVSIKDLVTILEVVGDNMEDIKNVQLMTEHVRRGISRQICMSLMSPDGFLKAMVLKPKLEQELTGCLKDAVDGAYLCLGPGELAKLTKAFRKAAEDYGMPLIVVTEPALRIYLWNLIGDQIPSLHILSTAEIPQDLRINILGEIGETLGAGAAEAVKEEKEGTKGAKKKKVKKFWTKE